MYGTDIFNVSNQADEAVRRSAQMLIHVLDRFVPEACRREAYRELSELMLRNGVELTSKDARERYQAWEKTQLNRSFLETINNIAVVGDLNVPRKA